MLDRTTSLLAVALLCGSAAVTVALSRTLEKPVAAPPVVVAHAGPLSTHVVAPVGPVAVTVGPVAMDVRAQRSLLSPNETEATAMIELQADAATEERARPVAMVVVVDVSSSMSGAKIEDARVGARRLVETLRDDDVLGIVTFDSTASTMLPASRLGDARSSARSTVAGLYPRGGTCMSCGIELAEAVLADAPAGHDKRIVLFSDGHANEGVSEPTALAQLVATARDRWDLSVTTIGIGASYDAGLLNLIAERGMGGHLFSPGPGAIARILDRELSRIRGVVARDVIVELTPRPGVSLGAIDGEEVQVDGDVLRVHLGDMSSGDRRRMLVPMTLTAGHTGGTLQARFTYAAEVAPGWSELAALEVARSADPASVNASADPLVAVHVVQLAAANARSDALVSASSGDTEGARLQLRRTLKDTEAQQAVSASPELDAELDELQVTLDGLESWNQIELESMVRNTSAASLEAQRGVQAGERWNRAGLLDEHTTY